MPILKSHGTTSNQASHTHKYEIDENGNGVAYAVVHPNSDQIKHSHEIENYVVKSAQSNCYPNCADLYGFEGVGPHIHGIGGCDNFSSNLVPIAYIDKIVLEGGTSAKLPGFASIEDAGADPIFNPEKTATLHMNFKTSLPKGGVDWFSDPKVLNILKLK